MQAADPASTISAAEKQQLAFAELDRCLAASSSLPYPTTQPDTDSNFADLVMYYAEGLVQRNFRLKKAAFWEKQDRTTATKVQAAIDVEFTIDRDLHAENFHDKRLYHEWVKSRDARGTFYDARSKKGTDRDAFLLAMYMIAQHELLSFHPTVRNDETHEHNVRPCLKMSRKDSFFMVRLSNNAPIAMLQAATTREYRLQQAAKMREIMLSAKYRILANTCTAEGCHRESPRKPNFGFRFDLPIDRQISMRDAFLRATDRGTIKKEMEKIAVALCMGAHARLGACSAVGLLSTDLLAMVIECLVQDRMQGARLAKLITG
jgi:hypothetical protein